MITFLQAYLGLNTSDFHAKAGAAEKDLKRFAEGVGTIGKVFSAGGTITAVVSFFNSVVAAARESEDQLDANVQAVRRFGDSLDNAKETVSGWGIASVGVLNRVGEATGQMAKEFWAFARGRSDELRQQEAVAASTERAAAEAEARLAQAIKHQKEYVAVTEGLKKIDEERAAFRAKQLTDEEKLAAFANAAYVAAERANDATLTTLERRQALLDQRRAEMGMEEAQAALHAKVEAQRAKIQAEADKEAAAAAADRLKTQELLAKYAEEDADVKRRALSYEEQLGALTREKAELQKRIVSETITEEERRDALVRLRQTEKELATIIAGENERSAAAAAEELASREAAVIVSQKRPTYGTDAMNFLGGPRQYDDPARQLAYEQELVESVTRDIDREIAALEEQLRRNAASGSRAGRYQRSAIEDQLGALRDRRGNVADYVFDPDYQDALGRGIVGQRAEFYGDPGVGGRLEEQAKRQTSALETLDRRLRRAGFRDE